MAGQERPASAPQARQHPRSMPGPRPLAARTAAGDVLQVQLDWQAVVPALPALPALPGACLAHCRPGLPRPQTHPGLAAVLAMQARAVPAVKANPTIPAFLGPTSQGLKNSGAKVGPG